MSSETYGGDLTFIDEEAELLILKAASDGSDPNSAVLAAIGDTPIIDGYRLVSRLVEAGFLKGPNVTTLASRFDEYLVSDITDAGVRRLRELEASKGRDVPASMNPIPTDLSWLEWHAQLTVPFARSLEMADVGTAEGDKFLSDQPSAWRVSGQSRLFKLSASENPFSTAVTIEAPVDEFVVKILGDGPQNGSVVVRK